MGDKKEEEDRIFQTANEFMRVLNYQMKNV